VALHAVEDGGDFGVLGHIGFAHCIQTKTR
jgi:hypothetical protein